MININNWWLVLGVGKNTRTREFNERKSIVLLSIHANHTNYYYYSQCHPSYLHPLISPIFPLFFTHFSISPFDLPAHFIFPRGPKKTLIARVPQSKQVILQFSRFRYPKQILLSRYPPCISTSISLFQPLLNKHQLPRCETTNNTPNTRK